MKIQIDTEKKTITLNETTNLKNLFSTVKTILPKDWEEYELKIEPITNWVNPIYVQPINVFPSNPLIRPNYPWYEGPVYFGNAPAGGFGVVSGISLGVGGSGGGVETHFSQHFPWPKVYCVEIKDSE